MNISDYLSIPDPTFDQLNDFVTSLTDIDSTALDKEQARTSRVISALVKLLQIEGKKLREVMRIRDQIEHRRRKYYNMKGTPQEYKAEPLNATPLKTEIEGYLAVDEKMNIAKEAVAEADLRVRVVEDALKLAHRRSYDIKNMIAWKQLTQS